MRRYFFFFFGFFLTPPLGVPCADGAVLDGRLGIDGATSACMGADSGSDGRRFCIFCIRERLRASKRPRNMEEYVLNLRHCREHDKTCNFLKRLVKTHSGVVRNFKDEFTLGWLPFYTIAGLHREKQKMRPNTSKNGKEIIHCWEILCRVPLRPPDNPAMMRCRPCQHRGWSRWANLSFDVDRYGLAGISNKHRYLQDFSQNFSLVCTEGSRHTIVYISSRLWTFRSRTRSFPSPPDMAPEQKKR